MKRPRYRNTAMAVIIAATGTGALVIFFTATVSAAIQLILMVTIIVCLSMAGVVFCYIEPPLGYVLVIKNRKGPQVVKESCLISPFQRNIFPVQLLTPRWIDVNFDTTPFPKTRDHLPVRVKTQAKVAFNDKDETLIFRATSTEDAKEEALYTEFRNGLRGIISRLISEREYYEHIEDRNEFEKTLFKYWHSESNLFTLQQINLIEMSQVKLVEAHLAEIDEEKAKTRIEAIKAEENEKQNETIKKMEECELSKTRSQEENKRKIDNEIKSTNIQIDENQEEQKRKKQDLLHASKIQELEHENEQRAHSLNYKLLELREKEEMYIAEAEAEEASIKTDHVKSRAYKGRRVAETETELEVQKLRSQVEKIRGLAEMELEERYVGIKEKELSMLKENKDGDFRYLLTKEVLSYLADHSKALSTVFEKARIYGSISDLPHFEKIIKTPTAVREVLIEIFDLIDDDVIRGAGRFFQGIAEIRNASHSMRVSPEPADYSVPGNASTQSLTTIETPDLSTEDAPPPPPPDDRDFDN